MPRKLPDGAIKSISSRIDTRPIRSTNKDHDHAFRGSVAVKDLPPSLKPGTWFKFTSTPDVTMFRIEPVDKANYDAKPKGIHEITLEPRKDGKPPTRARFLISPGVFEPYTWGKDKSKVVTAYHMSDGSMLFPAPLDRCTSDNPTRTVAEMAGIKVKPKAKKPPAKKLQKRERVAALATLMPKPTMKSLRPRETNGSGGTHSHVEAANDPVPTSTRIDLVDQVKARMQDMEEELRAWRNAFPMFGYLPRTQCIMRTDFSGEPTEPEVRKTRDIPIDDTL
jgi:hypothetical protein